MVDFLRFRVEKLLRMVALVWQIDHFGSFFVTKRFLGYKKKLFFDLGIFPLVFQGSFSSNFSNKQISWPKMAQKPLKNYENPSNKLSLYPKYQILEIGAGVGEQQGFP